MTIEDVKRHCHYKPARKGMKCGFGWKVLKAIESGELSDKNSLLVMRGTTDISLVDCPDCKDRIKNIVYLWE